LTTFDKPVSKVERGELGQKGVYSTGDRGRSSGYGHSDGYGGGSSYGGYGYHASNSYQHCPGIPIALLLLTLAGIGKHYQKHFLKTYFFQHYIYHKNTVSLSK
jgi:hypothetical protein